MWKREKNQALSLYNIFVISGSKFLGTLLDWLYEGSKTRL